MPTACTTTTRALEDDRCQSLTPMARSKKPFSTSFARSPHVLALPYPLPQALQAPIVAITEVNIDESLLKQNK